MKKVLFCLTLLLLCLDCAWAAELPDSVKDAVPPEAAVILPEMDTSASHETLWQGLGDLWHSACAYVRTALETQASGAALLLGVVLLCSLAESCLAAADSPCVPRYVSVAGALAITLVAAGDFRRMMGLGVETMSQLEVFSKALLPTLSAAVAAAGIVRTKDLKTWERLPNLVTKRSPQQRNVDLLPEFVNGKYAFYTRPMDDFIDTGSGGGVGFGLCEDITHAVIDEEIITSPRRYHTITEAKNGEGATPIKTEKGWLHIAHGVRNTAAGLRYVIYVFVTALDDPSKVIAEPSGFLIAPRDWERVGDVSNVVFTNGAIADDDGSVYIYYAASDTRLHVASTTIDKLLDFAFNTPADPLRSVDCVKQRCALIDKNLEYLKSIGE
mgnify:CR=1 FL=1